MKNILFFMILVSFAFAEQECSKGYPTKSVFVNNQLVVTYDFGNGNYRTFTVESTKLIPSVLIYDVNTETFCDQIYIDTPIRE